MKENYGTSDPLLFSDQHHINRQGLTYPNRALTHSHREKFKTKFCKLFSFVYYVLKKLSENYFNCVKIDGSMFNLHC